MLVVSNTSPLLNLAIVHRLELLHQQFEAVLIPPAVREELQIDSEPPVQARCEPLCSRGGFVKQFRATWPWCKR